ncbi:MAG: nucleoside-diphosphate kinase [Tissierellaceae bacterium]|nr:nucleoside-diphosphate kinase [Tissierellaceae bacterium]
MEKTFIMIKPDGVERRLMGEIISRIEKKGFKITRAKLVKVSKELAEEHYIEHREKPFFGELIDYILEGEVMAMEVEGDFSIEIMRLMIGHRDPKVALPGTIRGDFAHSLTKNIIHGSDSIESAERELKLWFD